MRREKRVLMGGVIGALVATYLVIAYHAFTSPQMLKDGQYAMIFMFVCPIGYLTGSLLSDFMTRHQHEDIPFSPVGIMLGGSVACFFGGPILGVVALMPIGLVIEAVKSLR